AAAAAPGCRFATTDVFQLALQLFTKLSLAAPASDISAAASSQHFPSRDVFAAPESVVPASLVAENAEQHFLTESVRALPASGFFLASTALLTQGAAAKAEPAIRSRTAVAVIVRAIIISS